MILKVLAVKSYFQFFENFQSYIILDTFKALPAQKRVLRVQQMRGGSLVFPRRVQHAKLTLRTEGFDVKSLTFEDELGGVKRNLLRRNM